MEVNILTMTVIVVIYIGILSILAFQGYRHTRTADDFMVAGRNVRPWIMSLSYGATFISTSAIVGFGGQAGVFGFSLLWLTFLNIFLGIIVAFAFFGVRIRRMSANLQATTFPSMLGQRYGSRFITIFSGLMIFIFMPAYTSIIIIGGARFVQIALQMPYNLALFILAMIVAVYVLTGGLKSVMYTDAFCALVMLLGMVFLLYSTYKAVGGVISGHQALTAMAHLVPESMTALGHQGWTAMPALGSPYWWIIVSSIIMGVGIGVLAQPQLAMRFMTVKNDNSIYRAITVGSIFIFFMTGTAFIVGPLSNVFFYNTQGLIAIQAAGEGGVDAIIPTFINALMPPWFIYLFMLTLLSAAISTTSSLIHVQGAAMGKDILETSGLVKEPNGDRSGNGYNALSSRIGVLIGVVLAIILAYILPGGVIARATSFWFGICAAGFLPSLIGALYWKRGTRAGAAASIITGYAASILGFLFLHISESGAFGIAEKLFGKPALLPFPWTHVNPLFYALPLSALVFVAVSLLTKKPEQELVARCYEGIK